MGLSGVITHTCAVSCAHACRSSCKDPSGRSRRPAARAPMNRGDGSPDVARGRRAPAGRARRPGLLITTDDRAIGDGLSYDTPRITPAQRDATARYSPDVPAADRAWIEAAIAAARPEAQRLIAEVDGLVEYRVHRGDPVGVTRSRISPDGASFEISFDVGSLDGERRQDRFVTVLHEYGHAIDLALVPRGPTKRSRPASRARDRAATTAAR